MTAKDVRFKIKIHNSLKLFWSFSFKIDSKTLDPDPNSMYLDPQHWCKQLKPNMGTQNWNINKGDSFIPYWIFVIPVFILYIQYYCLHLKKFKKLRFYIFYTVNWELHLIYCKHRCFLLGPVPIFFGFHPDPDPGLYANLRIRISRTIIRICNTVLTVFLSVLQVWRHESQQPVLPAGRETPVPG